MLYKPLISEIEHMRDFLEQGLCDLLAKMELLSKDLDWGIPEGTIENSTKKWGDIFRSTQADTAQKVQSAVSATQGKILSRKTATRHLAPEFGVENVEEELKQIESESQQDMEDELMNFQGQSDIETQNAMKQQPPTAKPPAGGPKK